MDILDELHFERLVSHEDACNLIRFVTRDEIVEALSTIHSSKAPGPDGYNSLFFKSAWSVVGDDFVASIKNFLKSGKLLKEVNSAFITLVVKCENPSIIVDFRPISSCNVLYKCIT